jgi:ribosomal protein L37AE/L43A
MKEKIVVVGLEPKFEYFCWNCGQLRLSFTELWTCGNCGSIDIKKGDVGSLNKAKLLAQRQRKRRYAPDRIQEP